MDQFSSDKLNDIASLYENIHYGTSEAEVLNEYAGQAPAAAPSKPRFGPTQAQQAQGAKTQLQRGGNVAMGGGTGHLNSAQTKAQGRTVIGFDQTKVAGPRGGTVAAAVPKTQTLGGQTLYQAKLGGKTVFVGAKKPGAPQPPGGSNPPPGRNPPPPGGGNPPGGTRPPATGAPGGKVIPTKPAGAPAGAPVAARRAATGDELRAAQAARQSALASNPNDKKGAEQAAVSAGVRRSLPTTGPTPAIPSASSVAADVAKANSPSVMNRPAPAGSALARQQAAQRPATTAQATAAAPSASPAASGSVVPATNAAAAAPRPKPMVPARAPAGAPLRPEPLFQSYEYEDVYDLVLEYLITEGYADTNESALAIMTNMSEEWKESIVEEVFAEGYVPWDFGPKQKAKAKHEKLAQKKAAGGSAPGTATRANKIASVARDMRTTLDKDSANTGTNPKKQGLQPSTQRHTAAALRGAGGGTTARTKYDVKSLG
jgi:hypothetical protein